MAANFQLVSPSFMSGGPIPAKHTCDGANVSPPLNWHDEPEASQTLALIVDDPDAPAGPFVHWVLFNLPPEWEVIPEGVQVDRHFEGASRIPVEGVNDFGNLGYGGPCPPAGSTHHYYFRLYALDTAIDLGTGAKRQQVVDAMAGHILSEAELIGTYSRPT